MHEIRATIPPHCASGTVRLAFESGIERASVSDVYVHGLDARRTVVSVETSTTKANAFVEALLTSPVLVDVEYTITSRQVRSIIDGSPVSELTRPMVEPFPEVMQDLWQLSHISSSYVARAGGGAVLMASGVIENSPIAIVVAALFLPFLSQVLAASFGLWSRDWELLRRGLRTILISTVLAFTAGAVVAYAEGGPIRFLGFKSLLSSFVISAIVGVAAGLSTADDAGRRYLIGVAAAVQLAVFPAWFGAAMILGLPPRHIVASRFLTFAVNLTTISGAAVLAFAALHLKHGRFNLPHASR